jgi:predicted nucleotidyltransferase
MAIRTAEEIKEIVHRYYRILVKSGLPVEKVILFGSYTRGEQTENSDIDLAVVLKEYSSDRFNTRLMLMKYSRDFEDVIEPHPFLASEFNNYDPFAAEILTHGIEVTS